MQKAVREPIMTIVRNAGVDPSSVVEKVLANSELSFGYDAMNDTFVDMFKAGIIDPTKVIRTALQVIFFFTRDIFQFSSEEKVMG